jgi:hypothetical protein
VYFLNMISKVEETSITNSNQIPFINKIIHSKNNKYFIGNDGDLLAMVQYDSQLGINEDIKLVQTLFPNPATSSVTIHHDCNEFRIYYKILNPFGQILIDSKVPNTNNSLQLDFTQYPAGLYFIHLNCGQDILTYKVIKE